MPELYRLEHVQVVCGNREAPTATVRLITPEGEERVDAAVGTGPVDAVYKAINRIVNIPNRLIEFSVQSVTAGIDAIGEVTIRLRHEDRIFSGHAANTDIIVASAQAYMNALNKLYFALHAARSTPEQREAATQKSDGRVAIPYPAKRFARRDGILYSHPSNSTLLWAGQRDPIRKHPPDHFLDGRICYC